MGKTKDLGHLAHIVAYDAENHITVPAGITMHTNQLVASQAWVTTELGSYALSTSLGSYVPTSRTITINGTVFDLSENRSWDITSMIYPAAGIPLSTGTAWGSSITNNSANWNTAYGWGNHATAGYLTGITSTQVTTALGYTPVPQTRIITINGVALDLSADRSWTIAASGGVTSFNTRTGAVTLSSADVTTAIGYTPYNSTNPNGYITSSSSITGTSAGVSVSLSGANAANVIYATIADNDFFRIRVGGDSSNAGWAEIATADDGTEPIYVRQYTGVFSSLTRTATLLDGSGNTNFPNTVYAAGYRGNANVAGTGEATWHPAGIYTTGTSWLYGTTYRNGATTYGQGWMYLDNNYGHSIVGVYSSTRYQGVFAMGDAYKLPADGSGVGSLYGMTWSHPNAGGVAGNLNTHGLLVLENGSFLAAISGSIRARDDMRAPIFYDSNDTGYYLDLNSTSNSAMRIRGGALFGPNPTWGAYLRVGSNGNTDYAHASVVTTDGNLHLDPASGKATYINYYVNGTIWLNGTTYSINSNGSYYNGTSAVSNALSGFDKTNPSFGAVYASNWFRAQGDCGLYSQDYGGHLRRNASSSHGTWEIFGYNKGGYTGMLINDPQGYYNNYMHEGGNGGLYSQNYRGDWIWYHSAGNNCTSFNGSTTDSGVRMRVNGSFRVTQDSSLQGYTGFGANVQFPTGYTQYHGTNEWYNWRDWGGWGGYWISRNGGDMIMNLYALYSVTGSISDMRYKKDVVALPYGLNELMQLNPIKYHYNLPKESMLANDPDYFLGFSAQEVQGIIPEAVHEKISEDSESMKGMLAITMNELIPVTVQAIKEQQVIIHNQGIRIQKLESLVNQLLNN